ncbi:transposase family protein [Trichocoleus desertorum]|uniref:transposase family protein n=1 Tax=Trichocoleus desertorum TaxID=1481672 RepID=UPI003D660374
MQPRSREESYAIELGDCLLLNLSSTQTIAPCPLGGGLTHRIHSHYERTIADLSCVHFRFRLILQVCKFFCPNSECRRHIFTEQLPEVAAPWRRKTVRLIHRLQSIGLALGVSQVLD